MNGQPTQVSTWTWYPYQNDGDGAIGGAPLPGPY